MGLISAESLLDIVHLTNPTAIIASLGAKGMVKVTIYKPGGEAVVFENLTSASSEEGVLRFNWRHDPARPDSYTVVRTSCPFYVEERFEH